MNERRDRRNALLRSRSIDPDSVRLLAGDASNRRYFRTPQGVLMDAPPELEDVGPFVRMSGHLRGLGLSAPEVLAEDRTGGWLLLEDLGDALFSRVLAAGTAPDRMYEMAVDVLAVLARCAPPEWLARYDLALLQGEADLFLDWYLPAAGVEPDPGCRAGWRAAWKAALTPHLGTAPVLVLRDCHVDNLLWLPDRPPPANVGLLDFQDARAGHPAYDLASLLDDVRRPLPAALAADLTERFLAAVPLDTGAFHAAFAVLSVQRSSKILGIFTRLAVRDGKPGYLAWLPDAWRLLEHRLPHAGLEPVRAWFERYVPLRVRQQSALAHLGRPPTAP